MSLDINEHDRVVLAIKNSNEKDFKVLTNLGDEQNFIGPMFPDLILLDLKTGTPRFIIEIRKNGNIAPCIQQWKNISSIPATLYLVVPEDDLTTAKSIAQVVGLQNRFGTYKINETDQKVIVKFE